MQPLKEPGVVSIESFLIELIEGMTHKCSKKKAVFKIFEELKTYTDT